MSTYDGKILSTRDFDFDIHACKKQLADLFFPVSSRAPIQRLVFLRKLNLPLLTEIPLISRNFGNSQEDFSPLY